MADADVVQHPNPDLLDAVPDEPAPAEQPQPADQTAAVPVVSQQELEVVIPLPNYHDLRSLLLFLLETIEPFRMIQWR